LQFNGTGASGGSKYFLETKKPYGIRILKHSLSQFVKFFVLIDQSNASKHL